MEFEDHRAVEVLREEKIDMEQQLRRQQEQEEQYLMLLN